MTGAHADADLAGRTGGTWRSRWAPPRAR